MPHSIAVVTGANGGIGRETVRALLDEDVQVAVDGAHAEAAKLSLQAIVEPIGRRVTTRAVQQLQDSLALAAPFVVAVLLDLRAPTP